MVLAILSICLLINHVNANRQAPNLWAAVGTGKNLYQELWNEDLMIHFTLVNDGSETIDPKTELSKLIINGKVLEDSAFIFSNGIRPLNWKALAPGEVFSISMRLNHYFKEPGIYTVSWKGENFEAQPTVFRVMPLKEVAPDSIPAKLP